MPTTHHLGLFCSEPIEASGFIVDAATNDGGCVVDHPVARALFRCLDLVGGTGY